MNLECQMATLRKVLCRLCAKQDENCVDVFGDEGKHHMLERKIRVCLPINVKEDDVLPRQICLQCLNSLEASFDLYSGSLQAQTTIKKILGMTENVTSFESCNSSNNDISGVPLPDMVQNKPTAVATTTVSSTIALCKDLPAPTMHSENTSPSNTCIVEQNAKKEVAIDTPSVSFGREMQSDNTAVVNSEQATGCCTLKLQNHVTYVEDPPPKEQRTRSSSMDTNTIVLTGENVKNVEPTLGLEVATKEDLSVAYETNATASVCQEKQSTIVDVHSNSSEAKTSPLVSRRGSNIPKEKSTVMEIDKDEDDIKLIVNKAAPVIEVMLDGIAVSSRFKLSRNLHTGPTVPVNQERITRSRLSKLNHYLSCAEELRIERHRQRNKLINKNAIIEINDEDDVKVVIGENNIPKNSMDVVNDEQKRRNNVAKLHSNVLGLRETPPKKARLSAVIEIDEDDDDVMPLVGENAVTEQHLTRAPIKNASSSLCQVERHIQKARTVVANDEQEISSTVVELASPSSNASSGSLPESPSTSATSSSSIIEIDEDDVSIDQNLTNVVIKNIVSGVRSVNNLIVEIEEDDEDDDVKPIMGFPSTADSRKNDTSADTPTGGDKPSASARPRDDPGVGIKQEVNGTALIECEYCHNDFPPDTLVLHRVLHFRERFFTCLDCGKNFFTVVGLEGHRCGVMEKMVPLLEICRRAILRRMGKQQLQRRIMSLDLPLTLKEYLLYRNHR